MTMAEIDASPASETTDAATADVASPGTAETQAPATNQGDQAASTPDAPQADEPKSLLEAVMRRVEPAKTPPLKGEDGTPAEPGPATDQTATPTTPDPALDADPTADELKAYVPRTRQRIERLLQERNTARTEADGAKTAADQWRQMDSYLQRHDLAAEDVNLLLGIGAALRRGDFKAFKDGVAPYLELANQHLGLSLPPDLTAAVEKGEISEPAAKELSQARLANSRLQGTVTAAQQQRQQAEQARAVEAHRLSVEQAVEQWETGVKATDPDYKAKALFIVDVSRALIQQYGPPKTPADAVEYAKRAHARAGELLAQGRPAPSPTRPAPNSAASQPGGRPAPRSMMEAAELGLEMSRRRRG